MEAWVTPVLFFCVVANMSVIWTSRFPLINIIIMIRLVDFFYIVYNLLALGVSNFRTLAT